MDQMIDPVEHRELDLDCVMHHRLLDLWHPTDMLALSRWSSRLRLDFYRPQTKKRLTARH
jgi:hypothetical protein